jgi:hypothetical protein
MADGVGRAAPLVRVSKVHGAVNDERVLLRAFAKDGHEVALLLQRRQVGLLYQLDVHFNLVVPSKIVLAVSIFVC